MSLGIKKEKFRVRNSQMIILNTCHDSTISQEKQKEKDQCRFKKRRMLPDQTPATHPNPCVSKLGDPARGTGISPAMSGKWYAKFVTKK